MFQEGDIVRINDNFFEFAGRDAEEIRWRGKICRLGLFDEESGMWEVWANGDFIYAEENEFELVYEDVPYDDITKERR